MIDYAALTLGARPLPAGGTKFRVWAPKAQRVQVKLISPEAGLIDMTAVGGGYFEATSAAAGHGTRYLYVLDGDKERPDPASRCQPEGVHGPSEIVDPDRFPWSSNVWRTPRLADFVIYELHIGTFTDERNFEGAIAELDRLVTLGVTAIELMPIAQFPGERNWGYDGVFPFAAHNSYGGPFGLARLVDACHQRGLAVMLDVVYNHLGPEGNYLGDFGHYFTDRHRTPWGDALNFDGPHSDEVRRFFIESALYWFRDLRIDAFRLDAVHAIVDQRAARFLSVLGETLHLEGERQQRRAIVIAETDLNDPSIIRSQDLGGLGLDAQWCDEFHHALHTLMTGEQDGYYADFGSLQQMSQALRRGYVYTGDYSTHRGFRHGVPPINTQAEQFVVFTQNHDQIGNRALGERLATLVDLESAKLAAGVMLLSPFVPLIFMGEEYGETAPFQYFTSHSDPDLVEAVRAGRRAEFASFAWTDRIPDPQSPQTFERSTLQSRLRDQAPHRQLADFYATLIALRAEVAGLREPSLERQQVDCYPASSTITCHRWYNDAHALVIFHFGTEEARQTVSVPAGRWSRRIGSADSHWGGVGSTAPEQFASQGHLELTLTPRSVLLYERVADA